MRWDDSPLTFLLNFTGIFTCLRIHSLRQQTEWVCVRVCVICMFTVGLYALSWEDYTDIEQDVRVRAREDHCIRDDRTPKETRVTQAACDSARTAQIKKWKSTAQRVELKRLLIYSTYFSPFCAPSWDWVMALGFRPYAHIRFIHMYALFRNAGIWP